MDLQSIRQQKHQAFLKQKQIEDELLREQQRKINEELERINDLFDNVRICIEDIKRFDVMRILLIVSTFLRHIDSDIEIVKKYNRQTDLIPIFFSLVNRIIEIRETNTDVITINEIKFLNNIKNNLYKIMDIIEIDRSLLDIELMDTTNDVEYARNLHKKINGF
jgi:hypothetical protein